MAKKIALEMRKGSTIAIPLRIESQTLTYKPITGISLTAPIEIEAPGHGLADGWKAAVMNAGGTKQINAANNPPSDAEFRAVTVVDADTIQFNAVNATAYTAYTSGGHLVYYAPVDLSAFASARMTVKNRVGGTEIASFTTANGGLELEPATNTLWILMEAADSAAITAKKGVFDIELIDGSGNVNPDGDFCAAESTITFLHEITT